jgi:hypothetical protein
VNTNVVEPKKETPTAWGSSMNERSKAEDRFFSPVAPSKSPGEAENQDE